MTCSRRVVIHAGLYLTFARIMIHMCWTVLVHDFILFASELLVCCQRSLNGLWSAHVINFVHSHHTTLTLNHLDRKSVV